MANPYIGEIRMFGGNFAPVGWAFCNGQLMQILQNTALFQLIGTTYGGDGTTTFGLPNLQGRLPIHQGTSVNGGGSFVIGQLAGEENHTVNLNEITFHNHVVAAAAAPATSTSPSGNVYGGGGAALYRTSPPSVQMNANMIGANSGNQPHNNLMPFLCVSFIIALFGIFPSSN
jgi:microcystin-dependent protein